MVKKEKGSPGGPVVKNPPQCKRRVFNPWVRKFPLERNGSPHQYSCLENSIDGGACHAIVHGITKSWTHLSTQYAKKSVMSSMFRAEVGPATFS